MIQLSPCLHSKYIFSFIFYLKLRHLRLVSWMFFVYSPCEKCGNEYFLTSFVMSSWERDEHSRNEWKAQSQQVFRKIFFFSFGDVMKRNKILCQFLSNFAWMMSKHHSWQLRVMIKSRGKSCRFNKFELLCTFLRNF